MDLNKSWLEEKQVVGHSSFRFAKRVSMLNLASSSGVGIFGEKGAKKMS